MRGASHRRRAVPNQDSIGWFPASACGPSVAVAVADGHGSTACCRSDAGSELAVRTSIALLEEFLERRAQQPGSLHEVAENWVPREMDVRWRRAVTAHLAGQPLSAAELARMRTSGSEPAGEPWIAYGSTILSVLATSQFVMYVQLGDGDILTVSEDGAVSRPWPVDQRLLGVETTSLCTASSRSDMRVPACRKSPAGRRN